MLSQKFARSIFLLFIVIISVYFLVINKRTYHENFNNNPSVATHGREASIQKIIETTPDAPVKPEKTAPDSLIPNDPRIQSDVIRDIYQKLIKRFPTPDETDFYRNFIGNKEMTPNQLSEIIKSSAESLAKMLPASTSSLSQVIYGTEDDVVEIYNNILQRNPDENELTKYSQMLATDKKFTREKLRQLLFNSDEYDRMEKTQNNSYNSELIGGITDRQLTLMVQTNYKSITGLDDLDDDTLKFLKRKFVQFNLDETMFASYIKAINNVEGAASASASDGFSDKIGISKKSEMTVKSETRARNDRSDPTSLPLPGSKKAGVLSDIKQEVKALPSEVSKSVTTTRDKVENLTGAEQAIHGSAGKNKSPVTSEIARAASINTIPLDKENVNASGVATASPVVDSDTKNYYDKPNIINIYTGGPNQEVIDQLLSKVKSDNNGQYLDSANVIKTIKSQNSSGYPDTLAGNYAKSTSTLTSNIPLNSDQKGGQNLAGLQSDRNWDEMHYTCERNKRFGDKDEDLVLDPTQKWSVPQVRAPVCEGGGNDYQPMSDQTSLIGTLLNNAYKTSVGSILPLYPKKGGPTI